MSIMIMSRLFRMNLGGCNRKLLAVRLADFADDDGRGIYPGVKRLAKETELSERTIQRILSDFVSEGILVVVQEASGRPGQATKYDFDLDILFSYKPQTGDAVTPVADGQTGDKCAETGDTDDVDGCHGVTRTVIEPSEPPLARERAKEGSFNRIERNRIEREFISWFDAYGYGVVDFARNTWFSLSADERAECIRRSPEYLRQTPKSKRPAAATYLKNKHWLDFAEVVQEAASTVYNPFSRAWMALRLSELLKPMATSWPVMTAFQRMKAAEGAEAAKVVEMERREKYGWPKVNTLHDLAANAKGALVSPELQVISENFVKVHRDSELAIRWKAMHARHGWPWLPVTAHEWLYFPEGEPEEAMAEFQTRLNEGKRNDA